MRAFVALVCASVLTPLAASGQICDSVTSRTTLAEMSGFPVRSVAIETHAPPSLPIASALLDRLHVRTREATIRRLVLVHPGDILDTLRVAESLRRLRQIRYLNTPAFHAVRCDGVLDLTVVTFDLWSARPSLQLRSASQSIALTERNVLGTGREVSLGVRSDAYGTRPTATLHDPWLFGRNASLDFTTSGDAERGAWSVATQTRERSVLDERSVYARFENSAFDAAKMRVPVSLGATVASIRRTQASTFGALRARFDEGSVWHTGIGAEYGLLAWETLADGPHVRLREFAGVDVGARRRSVAYDTLTWLLPANAIVDVPLATEFDMLVGYGSDFANHARMLHVDAWLGRMWIAGQSSLIKADVWGSGYQSRGTWSGASVRATLEVQRAAKRGVWDFRVGREQWFGADPDARTLVTIDPTVSLYHGDAREEPTSFAATLERTVNIRPLTRSYALAAGGFVAASRRNSADVSVVGLGLRLMPTRLGRATARLDVGAPLSSRGDIHRGAYVAIGISASLDQDRSRDGRRVR